MKLNLIIISQIACGIVFLSSSAFAQTDTSIAWVKLENPDLSQSLPGSFAYLVHALPSRARLQKILAAEKEGGMDISGAIDLVEHPELISHKQKLSTSVVTDKSHNTFERRGFGFIIQAPLENIVATRTQDMGSAVTVNPDQLENFFSMMGNLYTVQSPGALTADPNKMNEVLLRGISLQGTKLRIAALWAFSDGAGTLHLKPNELEDLKFLKNKLQLPIILLNEGINSVRMRLNFN